jgi:hypothetical protein
MSHDIAFLHTADVHIPTFQKLVESNDPSIRVRHDVNTELLSNAIRDGITEELIKDVEEAMREAAASNAEVVVCTCSTIGGVAERTVLDEPAVSMRVDRAMADAAIDSCQRILIVAAVESTLEPTRGLLNESANKLGKHPKVSLELIDGAWAQFELGEMDKYYSCIESYIHQQSEGYDGVILAQASMAPVAHRFINAGVRVFASPEAGVLSGLNRIREKRARC